MIYFGIRNEKFSSVAYVHLDTLLYLWNMLVLLREKGTGKRIHPCTLMKYDGLKVYDAVKQ